MVKEESTQKSTSNANPKESKRVEPKPSANATTNNTSQASATKKKASAQNSTKLTNKTKQANTIKAKATGHKDTKSEKTTDFAIVKYGKHQFYLVPGEKYDIVHINVPEGKELTFDQVLAIQKDGKFTLGTPTVDKAFVKVFVVKHKKGPKEYGFKYKAKSRYRRRWGYRQLYTRIRVVEVGFKK